MIVEDTIIRNRNECGDNSLTIDYYDVDNKQQHQFSKIIIPAIENRGFETHDVRY